MIDAGAPADTLQVAVGDLAIGRAGRERRLLTSGLGSCIGVAIHDPIARIGGLLHFMLPRPPVRHDVRAAHPAVYATTGIAQLLQRLVAAGAESGRFVIHAAGAAEMLHDRGALTVGRQNRTALVDVLAERGLRLEGADFGGRSARTLWLDLETGEVAVRTREGTVALGRSGAGRRGATPGS